MPTLMEIVSHMKEKIKNPPAKKEALPPLPKDALSTGLTVANLACSGHPDWAFQKKDYILFVGDSQAGKTTLALQCMAEASINPSFKDYRLVYDNPERGAKMDKRKFFGEPFAKRLQEPKPSKFLEDFYDRVEEEYLRKEPFFMLLDSEDALEPFADFKKREEERKRRKRKREGTPNKSDEQNKTKGSYGMAKAKGNSVGLRGAFNVLEENGSILIVIKHTRQAIGAQPWEDQKTRNGGLALTFFAQQELWFSIKGKIKRVVNEKKRVIGSILGIHVKKNRVNGRDRSVEVCFYPSLGFSEIDTNIHFLINENHWKETGSSQDTKKVDAPEFGFKGKREALAQKIESEGKEVELKELVVKVWNEIEEQCRVVRKNKYTLNGS